MLTKKQRAFYNENGYILVKGLLSRDEAAALRQEAHALIERLSARRNVDATWGSARKAVEQAKDTKLLHCHDVQFQAAPFSQLLVDERLTGVAADIIGSPNVQLHHNKLFIKPPEKGCPSQCTRTIHFFHTRIIR